MTTSRGHTSYNETEKFNKYEQKTKHLEIVGKTEHLELGAES